MDQGPTLREIEHRLRAIEEGNALILKVLNGTNGQKGVMTRLALLENAQASTTRFFWIVIGATATSVIGAAVSVIGSSI